MLVMGLLSLVEIEYKFYYLSMKQTTLSHRRISFYMLINFSMYIRMHQCGGLVK